MFRCALLATALLAVAPAFAQAPRPFPATALRAELVVTAPPEVLLNGRAARLSPGARIRGDDNLLKVSGALIGFKLPVHYTLNAQGEVQDLWVLNTAERANQPWPTTREEAARWAFDPAVQRWSKP